jgi:hypothetical protein
MVLRNRGQSSVSFFQPTSPIPYPSHTLPHSSQFSLQRYLHLPPHNLLLLRHSPSLLHDSKEKASWKPESHVETLLETMIGQIEEGHKVNGLKPAVWNEFTAKVNERIGESYDTSQMKDKFQSVTFTM